MGYTLHDLALARPPIAQQRVARNLVLNYYTRHGFARFEAFQETLSIPTDAESYVPDVLFVDARGAAAVAVELCATKKVEQAKFAMVELLGCSTTEEVFVLDYQTKRWYYAARKQQRKAFFDAFQDDGFAGTEDLLIQSNHSYSTVLGIDLSDYIALP